MRGVTWLLAGLLCLGCDDGGGGGAGGIGGMGGGMGGMGGAIQPDMGPPAEPEGDCDPLDEAACALPWPSDLYLRPDADRDTGFQLRFGPTSLPRNVNGQSVDPAPYARLDGYSIGTQILAVFPNLDITPIAGELDIEASLDEDASVLLFEVGATARRIPYFAELDGSEADPARQTLFVRPMEVLKEDTTYVVAFRGLRDTSGAPIPASAAFMALRDGDTTGDAALGPRQARFAETFAFLEGQGVDPGNLNLAWSFRTASCEGLHGPMLHIRDAGFEAAGPDGPEITFEEVEEYAAEEDESGLPVHPHTWLRIRGTFKVPHFMKQSPEVLGVRGWTFNDGDAAFRPAQDGWREPTFWLIVPHSAKDGRALGLVNYGHGLFGDGEEVLEPGWTRPCGRFPERECGWWNSRISNEHDLIFFGADLVGMSAEDFDAAGLTIVSDLSLFPWISDRLHQGMLEYLLLARGMKQRLGAMPGIAGRGINVDPSQLYYSGISQGGIFGAAYLALSPDTERAHIGVPGQNYSMYLARSTGFEPFFAVMSAVYQDSRDQAILLNLVQLLWDGTENSSYLRHVSAEPLPGTEPHAVLAAPVRGDYLVPPITFEAVARTADLGIPALENYDAERALTLADHATYPHAGSGIVLYDLGNPWPEPGNHVPAEHPLGDPHEDLRHLDAHAAQMVEFFRTGQIVDVCGGQPCTPTVFDVDGD